jgi:hypothetical protein
MTSTEDKLYAAAMLMLGLGAAAGLVFAAQGRTREAYPFAIAGTIVATVITSARALGGERRCR